MDRWSTEDFRAIKILYDVILVVTGHYAFVQTHSMYNTNSEPKWKHGS